MRRCTRTAPGCLIAMLITSGFRYTDIDAFACAKALEDALLCAGQQVRAVLPGPPNYSVPGRFKDDVVFTTSGLPAFDEITLVDVSDPDHLPDFGEPSQVSKVYDHHFGHEGFWQEKIGPTNTQIEQVGAAATLIWREIQELNVANSVSDASYAAISMAIVSNTCDMKLSICTDDDSNALADCSQRAAFEPSWKEAYFAEVDRFILGNFRYALNSDTKIVPTANVGTLTVGQVEFSTTDPLDISSERVVSCLDEVDVILVSFHTKEKTLCFTRDERVADIVSQQWRVGVQRLRTSLLLANDTLCLRKMILPALQN